MNYPKYVRTVTIREISRIDLRLTTSDTQSDSSWSEVTMNGSWTRIAAVALFGIGIAGTCSAVAVVPEVDPGSAANALALLTGALLIWRGRRRR